eukprot:COSAG05_NODE_74_length_21769_cov_194.316290_14_plen_91_part_00
MAATRCGGIRGKVGAAAGAAVGGATVTNASNSIGANCGGDVARVGRAYHTGLLRTRVALVSKELLEVKMSLVKTITDLEQAFNYVARVKR